MSAFAQRASVSEATAALSRHVAEAGGKVLPAGVAARARLHLLDTLAAMVSGSRLGPGLAGREWCRQFGAWEGGGATVVGAGIRTTAFAAALANGISAHADETDDSHAESLSHPGCAVLPAALAAAEVSGASGELLVRAFSCGYDVGCRVGRAVGLKKAEMKLGRPSSHALAGVFGAAAAVAVVRGLSEAQVRYALSYAAQSCGGATTWMGDPRHVEKAFVFAGMPASRGLLSATLVGSGFDGVEDVFHGTPNWLDAISDEPRIEELAAGLGTRFEVERTTLKKYSVGSPLQAAVEATLELVAAGVTADAASLIEVRIPADAAPVVDAKPVPSINAQYVVAATLRAQRFSFRLAHDEEAMQGAEMAALLGRTRLVADESLSGTRSAAVAVSLKRDGKEERLERLVSEVSGRPSRPMSEREVREKAMDLLAPVLGAERSETVCDMVLRLEEVPQVGLLTELVR